MNKIEQLKQQTAQYATEHITGKGMHTGIAWLRDSFNEFCEAMGANDHLVAQRVAIDCIHALDQQQLEQLDGVLNDLSKKPNLGINKGISR